MVVVVCSLLHDYNSLYIFLYCLELTIFPCFTFLFALLFKYCSILFTCVLFVQFIIFLHTNSSFMSSRFNLKILFSTIFSHHLSSMCIVSSFLKHKGHLPLFVPLLGPLTFQTPAFTHAIQFLWCIVP
jgi:hypothetical protein